jgi:hypothetical protein
VIATGSEIGVTVEGEFVCLFVEDELEESDGTVVVNCEVLSIID